MTEVAISHPKRPGASAKRADWKTFWLAQRQFWRTEPEIPPEQQTFLAQRRLRGVDYKTGEYPFRDVALTRADVEWLLATHDTVGIVGPVEWRTQEQADRRGLDLRGADLRGVDLSGLPLTRVRCGMPAAEWLVATPEQREWAAAHLEGANLFKAHLERAHFIQAHLEGADLRLAHLEAAVLFRTHLEGITLTPDAFAAIHQRNPALPQRLPAANLSGAFFNDETDLDQVILGDATSCVSLANVHWNGANLTVVQWSRLRIAMLGEEYIARQDHTADGKAKDHETRLNQYEVAVQTNRQFATILRGQGLNEVADQFVYRAQVLQRRVLRMQGPRSFGGWLGSLGLDVLAGYGFRPGRTLLVYLLLILGFAAAYMLFGTINGHAFHVDEALVFSVTSFHGRGFFPGGLALDDPITKVAASEAIIGLLVEVSFIATFTQRFFAR